METVNPVFLLNKEGWKALPEIALIKWFSVIIDESRFIANPRSQVSKFFWENFRGVTHRIILTGTPDFKNKQDYYQQLTFLDRKNLPYKNFWEFRTRAFFAVGYEFILTKHHKNVLQKSLSDNIHSLTRKELKLGRTKEYSPRYITLPPEVQKAYNTLEKEYVLEYKNKVISKSIYATTSHIHLMRICGGFIDGKNVHQEKLKDLKYLLENDLKGEQVIIICRYIEEVEWLYKMLSKKYKGAYLHKDVKRPDRTKIKNDFNSKKIQFITTSASIIAHGTDLSGGETIIGYSQPNGEEVRSQVEDRIITLKDTKNVLIIDLLVKGTVDEDARKAYIEGQSQRDMFERAVKRWKN